MAKIIKAAFADEYSQELNEQIEALKTVGYTHIEPRFISGKSIAELSEAEATELADKLNAAGIGVYSVGSPIGKISLSDDFAEHLALAERVFKIANILGATRVRIFSFYLPEGKSREECFPEVVERLSALLALADKYGLILCHENEARIFGESPEDCLRLLSHFGARLRAVFDMGNFVLDKYSPYPEAYELLSDYIDYFHIKDALYERAIVPAGCGEAKIKEILKKHLERGEDFVISLEPHLQSFGGFDKLTDSKFDNPYIFESTSHAFLCGAKHLGDILEEIEENAS